MASRVMKTKRQLLLPSKEEYIRIFFYFPFSHKIVNENKCVLLNDKRKRLFERLLDNSINIIEANYT